MRGRNKRGSTELTSSLQPRDRLNSSARLTRGHPILCRWNLSVTQASKKTFNPWNKLSQGFAWGTPSLYIPGPVLYVSREAIRLFTRMWLWNSPMYSLELWSPWMPPPKQSLDWHNSTRQETQSKRVPGLKRGQVQIGGREQEPVARAKAPTKASASTACTHQPLVHFQNPTIVVRLINPVLRSFKGACLFCFPPPPFVGHMRILEGQRLNKISGCLGKVSLAANSYEDASPERGCGGSL